MAIKRGLASAVLLSLLSSASLFGQLYAPPGGKFSAGVVSKNIWRGFDVLPDDEPALQGSLHYVFGASGFETLVAGSFALSNRSRLKALNLSRDLDEIDFILKYYRSLNQTFGLTVGLNSYFFPRKNKDVYSPEAFAGITLQNFPLFPTITFYYDFNLGDDLYVRLSLQQFVPMGERLFLLKIAAGYNNGQYGENSGLSDIEFNFSTD